MTEHGVLGRALGNQMERAAFSGIECQVQSSGCEELLGAWNKAGQDIGA